MKDERYKELMRKVGMPESQSLLGALQQAVNEATQDERKRCAELVPTNWLDPLLTGPEKVLPSTQPYRGPDIERLLRAIQVRIRDR